MECPNCGARNAEGAKFCIKCGANLLQPCPNCGAGNRSGARFCDECGHSLLSDEPDRSDRPKGRRRKALLAIVGLIVVVVALGAIAWFLWGELNPRPTPEPGESTDQVDTSPGWILHAVQADDGVTLEPWLIVRDIEGEEVGQIPLPGPPTFRDLYALASNLVATVENEWLLLNTSDFTAETLAIPAEEAADLTLNSGVILPRWPQRHAVLSNLRGTSAYLVNLNTGAVFDLLSVDSEMEYVIGGQFSPHEEYLALWADAGIWLLDTNHPEQSRKLEDSSIWSLNFSDDGTRIAYIQQSSDGPSEVVVESTAGPSSEVVLADDWFDSVDFVPGQEELVVMREEALSLLSLLSGEERELLALSSRYRPRFAPSGRMLLAGASDERGWHIVDLDQGTSRALDDITGLDLCFYDASARWALFRETMAWAAGVQVAVLDLETGAVVPLRGLDSEALFGGASIRSTSSDGRRLLMQGLADSETGREYWLVMADEGEARLLAEGQVSGASLSADGRWLVYSQWHEDQNIRELILLDVDSDERRSLGEGFAPVWVQP